MIRGKAIRTVIVAALAMAFTGQAGAQTFTPSVLLNFGKITGTGSETALVEGHDGYFYGVFPNGTANQGLIYKISPTGTFRGVYNFDNIHSSYQSLISPYTIMRGIDGNFYGLARGGGLHGEGGIYKLTADGVLTTFYSFEFRPDYTMNLVQGRDGTFYGIGTNYDIHGQQYAALFSVTAGGTYSDVPMSDRVTPFLTDGHDGFFYGAYYGGICRLSLTGVVTLIQQTQAATPLFLGRDANLYGFDYGVDAPDGGFFKMSPSGGLILIHTFGDGEGTDPGGQIAQDVNGKFYTTTGTDKISGGPHLGTVTSIDSAGTANTVLQLNNTYGAAPSLGVTLSNIGDLYVVTNLGGSSQYGTILKLARSAGGSATHFLVTPLLNYPDSIPAGSRVSFQVTALDSSNNNAQGYTGTVHFSSSDHAAVLPGNVKLTSGVGSFSATLNTIGNQTITATDTVNSGVTGVSPGINVPGPATHLVLTTASPVIAGARADLILRALDGSNDLATEYTGTLHFTSTNSKDVTPPDAGLAHGASTFSMNLTVAGSRTITVTDTVNSSLHASATIVVNPGPTVAFNVGSPQHWVNAGTADSVHVVARDQYNNITQGYTGTVLFKSSDHSAILPSGKLTNGEGFFNVTLHQAGLQGVGANDSINPNIAGSIRIGVYPLSATHLGVSCPASVTAGTPFNFSVKALDQYGNAATSYTGTVRFGTNAPRATMPADGGLTSGVGTFSATMTTVGGASANFKITGRDTSNTSISGTSAAIVVNAGP